MRFLKTLLLLLLSLSITHATVHALPADGHSNNDIIARPSAPNFMDKLSNFLKSVFSLYQPLRQQEPLDKNVEGG